MPTTEPTAQDPQFAVFNGSEEITEEMYKEVLAFVSFVNEKEANAVQSLQPEEK